MSTKEQLLQALDQASEFELEQILKFVSSLKSQGHKKPESFDSHRDAVWQAYLASKQEREEVYRRLANS